MTTGPARRIGKWVLIGSIGVVALVVLLRVGAGVYLRSAHGRAVVAGQLAAAIGLPVEVTEVDLGSRTSAVAFRVLDPNRAGSPDAEILTVESASADLTLADLVRGRASPTEVTLRGATLTLRLDAAGRVLTTLPTQATAGKAGAAVPRVRLENARVRIRQEGRPDFTAAGINLTAEPRGGTIALGGAADDPGWGKWTATGEADPAAKTGWVELAADAAPLTDERLRTIPFVPPSVWESVRPDGRGRVTVRLTAGPAGEVGYDVRVQPAAAALTLPDARVTLAGVTGTIRVHDGRLDLDGLSGKVAGGTVQVTGAADFRPEPTPVRFTVVADGLDVDRVPPEWGLTKEFGGRLRGKAGIDLQVHSDGRVVANGTGEGELVGATVLGFPAEVRVHLRAANGKLKLHGDQPPPEPAEPADLMPISHPMPALRHPLIQTLIAAGATVEVQTKPDPTRTDQTLLDATIRLRDIDLAQLLERLEVKLPYRIGGKVSVAVTAAVPLGQAVTRAAYKFSGTVTSPELTLEGLTVRDLTVALSYQNGKATLTRLTGTIRPAGGDPGEPGTFSGTASAAVEPPGDLTAALSFDRVPLGEVLKAIPGWALPVGGRVTGKGEFQAPFDKLSDPTTWAATAGLTGDDLTVAGRGVKGVRVGLTVANGVATIRDAAATVEGIPLTGSGTLALTGKYKFDAAVKAAGADVTDLRRLLPEAELPVPVEGVLAAEARVSGTAAPFTFAAAGTVKATRLALGKTAANHVELGWEATPDRVAVTRLRAAVFGGTVGGTADYPLDPKKAGAFDITFQDVDAAAASAFVPDFPVKITGRVSGSVAGTIPPAEAKQGRVGNLDLDLTAPALTVQGFPAERLVGKAVVRGGAIDYALEGKTLGGSFEVKGRYPGTGKKPDGPKADEKKDDRGSLRVTDLDLARVAPDLKLPSLAPLRGRVDVTFDYANDFSTGSGRVLVRNLAWGDAQAGQELTGVLVLRDGTLELVELFGSLGGGQLRGRGRVRVREPERNFFSLTLDRADAKRLLAPIPELDGVIDGDISLVVRGTVGREVRGSGAVTIFRGTVGGVEVAELRLPFTYATAPGGYGRLAVHEASTHAGAGRATGRVTVEWGLGPGARVDGQVQFVHVPLRAVVPGLGEDGLFGNGTVTGRFDLRGTNVRSADDLAGTLVATLNNTSVRELPLLRRAVPFLNPAGLTQPFQAGDIRATLARGTFRVQRLALANPAAQLFAEGTITTAGRLDLAVVAHTGQIGPDARGLAAFGLRLPAFGPIPLTLVRDVTNFLSNRTIRLTITGTVTAPVVRVNTAALLGEEAVRFFLTRYVVPADVADLLGAGGLGGLGSMRR